MSDHDHELLTIDEAADLVRAPVATLRYWRHLGTGPRTFRFGRRVVYRRTDIEDWVDAHTDSEDAVYRHDCRAAGGERSQDSAGRTPARSAARRIPSCRESGTG